tara:strand:+ start:45 stop:875 length:831 start_codon:yes stop_codon:yes gene_type:complete
MKNISDKIIRPIEEADEVNGRINRKLIQNIFFIDIDRPTKLNGFTPFMFREIATAFTEYENEKEALCAVVFTSGNNFCAGMDLKQMSNMLTKGDHSYLKPRGLVDPLSLKKPIRKKPLIVAAKGYTFTYGLELLLSSDIAICSSNTQFAMLEVLRGLLMTGGGTIRFVERAGWGNAMKYLLTGLKFDANESYRMNIVQEILEEDKLFTRAVELANLICSASPKAVLEVIENSRIALESPAKAISYFDKVQNKLINQKDFKEGYKAFIEKKSPSFQK